MSKKRLGLGGVAICLALLTALVMSLTAAAGQEATSHKGQNYKIFLSRSSSASTSSPRTGRARRSRQGARRHGDLQRPTEAVAAKQVPFINTAASRVPRDHHLGERSECCRSGTEAGCRARAKIISYDGDVARDARTIFVSPRVLSRSVRSRWSGSAHRSATAERSQFSRPRRRLRTRTPGSSS